MPKYLLRSEWPDYIERKFGVRYTKNTFQKLATTGGGPQYAIFGNKAVSTEEWLDEWAESRVSAPRRSTSEAA